MIKKTINAISILSTCNIFYTVYSFFKDITLFFYGLIFCGIFTLAHIFLIKFLMKEKEQLLNNINEQQEDLIDNNMFINKLLLVLNLIIVLSFITMISSLYGYA